MTNVLSLPAQETKATKGAEVQNKQPSPESQGTYYMLFFLLLTAMDIRQGTVLIKSKQLKENAARQMKLNRDNGNLTYAQVPEGAKQAEIDRVQAENQAISAKRENNTSVLIQLRQTAQVGMTEANSDVNFVEQDASIDTGWLKTVMSVFQVINKIAQARKGQ